jgi:hypothetical protein
VSAGTSDAAYTERAKNTTLKSVENAVPSEISAWCEMLLIAVFCAMCKLLSAPYVHYVGAVEVISTKSVL